MRTTGYANPDYPAGLIALIEHALSRPIRSVVKRQLAPRLGLMERFDAWMWKQEVRSREAYLAQAKDVYDLEARLRSLERRTTPNWP